MSHFTVLVIGENPEEQLEPFSENLKMPLTHQGQVSQEDLNDFIEYCVKEKGLESTGENLPVLYAKHGKKWNGGTWKQHADKSWHEYSTYNPNSKWDWYQLGGRWTGYFKLKDGVEVNLGEKAVLMDEGVSEGFGDQHLKSEIDFESMRQEAAEEASKKYDKVMRIFDDLPVNESWESVKYRIPDIEQARKFYLDQPRLKAVEENREKEGLGFFFEADSFLVDKEEYVQNAKDAAFTPFAVLMDGVWHEKGQMGWFGIARNEKDQKDWNKEVSDLIDSLPEDTLISAYDCHI